MNTTANAATEKKKRLTDRFIRNPPKKSRHRLNAVSERTNLDPICRKGTNVFQPTLKQPWPFVNPPIQKTSFDVPMRCALGFAHENRAFPLNLLSPNAHVQE